MKKYVVHLLRTRSFRGIWGWFSTVLIQLLGPRGAARLTYWGVDWGPFVAGRPTVLCLSRFHFDKDIAELRNRTGINYVCILGGFVRFQQLWFPKEMQIQTFYQGYQGEGRDEAIRLSTEYAAELFRLISKRRKISAVLSANFDYWQDIGFKKVCTKNSIPFLVLSREHCTIPAEFDKVLKWYLDSGYVFEGQGIAVAGSETKRNIELAPHIIDSANVHVTGFPRMDIWKEIDKSKSLDERKSIVLVTYTKNYYADDQFVEMAQLFASIAAEFKNSGINFVIKCKDYSDFLEVHDILKGHDSSGVQLVTDVPLYDLFPRSRLVIGFNSLALIEAVTAHCPVVSPHWGDCRKHPANLMYDPTDPEVAKCMKYLDTPQELREAVRRSVESPGEMLTKDEVTKFVNKYYFVPEADSSSAQVERFLLRYIRSDSKSSVDAM